MESSDAVVRTIGRMARESGLSVSALRFYDGAGVLTPAHVDPASGYRYYGPDQVVVARLVALLRRVGMPLAGIREVLAHRHDPAGGRRGGPARRADRGAVPGLPPAAPDGRPSGSGGRAALRAELAAATTRRLHRAEDGAEYEVAILDNGPDGIRVSDGPGVAVNREFLLEALDAGGGGQLLLALDGPITPLVFTVQSPRSVSLLMPVRL